MKYKTGDILVCKKDYYLFGNTIFTRDRIYKITRISGTRFSVYITDNDGDDLRWSERDVDEMFTINVGGQHDAYDYAMGLV